MSSPTNTPPNSSPNLPIPSHTWTSPSRPHPYIPTLEQLNVALAELHAIRTLADIHRCDFPPHTQSRLTQILYPSPSTIQKFRLDTIPPHLGNPG